MDELEQRIRAARPISGHRALPLTDRAKRELADLIVADALHPERAGLDPLPPPRRRRRAGRLTIGIAIAVAVSAVVGGVGLTMPWLEQPVYARTPAPLVPTAVDGSATELLRALSDGLAERTPSSTIRYQSWELDVTFDDRMQVDEVGTEPRDYTFELTTDGARLETRRGEPYDAAGNPVVIPGYDVGTLIEAHDYGPGYAFAWDEPPSTATDFGPYLMRGFDELSTGQQFLFLGEMLRERSPTTEQVRAALDLVSTLPNVEVDGRVTDRLGRTGISFSAADDRDRGGFRDHLIVSDQGLGIIAVETTYEGNDYPFLPQGAVMSYVAIE